MRSSVWLAIFFSLFLVSPVWAEVKLRAIYPNPVGTDEGEWIAVENLAEATTSAGLFSLRDTAGSVKTYTLESLKANELRLVTASQSGIALNNTGEAVELEAQGNLIERSPTYVASSEGQVWLQLSTGWQEVSLSEYFDRAVSRNWLAEPPPPNVDEAVDWSKSDQNVDPPISNSTSTRKALEAPTPKSNPLSTAALEFKPPRLNPNAVATPSGSWEWPPAPEPDYQAEVEIFLAWKRQALFGSLALMFAGGCWLLLVSPSLFQVWRWLRDELML